MRQSKRRWAQLRAETGRQSAGGRRRAQPEAPSAASEGSPGDWPEEHLGMDQTDLGGQIGRLARLGRQRDFSLSRFRKSLDQLARREEREEILRQLLTEWTGLPHSA